MTANHVKERRRLERERQKAQRERRKRLEAAAPALLAACKLLYEDWKTLTEIDYNEGNKDVVKITETVLSAMSKAGESGE